MIVWTLCAEPGSNALIEAFSVIWVQAESKSYQFTQWGEVWGVYYE